MLKMEINLNSKFKILKVHAKANNMRNRIIVVHVLYETIAWARWNGSKGTVEDFLTIIEHQQSSIPRAYNKPTVNTFSSESAVYCEIYTINTFHQ